MTEEIKTEEIDELFDESQTEASVEPDDDEKQVDTANMEVTKTVLAKLGLVFDDARSHFLTQDTPKSAIYDRAGRGGQTFKYIKGDYVKKVLNAVFAFQWDFEIVPIKEGELFHMSSRQVMVIGKLTIRDIKGVARITKMGIGKKDIAYPKNSTNSIPMDLGNDIKAAETDALKRCATGLGIGLDLYKGEKGDK